MKRHKLHRVEWRVLMLLWGCAIGTAAAGVSVLIADLVAGDWRYGTVVQLFGIALSVSCCSLVLWVTYRALKANHERDEINIQQVAHIVELDRIAASEIDRLEARLDRERRGARVSGTKAEGPASLDASRPTPPE
jgi:cytochrome c biogenesis protein ResB